MVAITSDIDWAPEPVIEYMVEIFRRNRIKCTFFCTHHSPVLLQSDPDLFELGIHPNFNPSLAGQGKPADSIVDELLEIYPTAKGVRSHSLTQSSRLSIMFRQKGMVYESNLFLPYQKDVAPSVLWNGLVRLPIVWEDDLHWEFGKTFEDLSIDMTDSGLKIFNFHPIHVFLNTTDAAHYENAKRFYHDAKELLKLKNRSHKKGVEDALMKLIEFIRQDKTKTFTLSEISQLTYNTDAAYANY